AGGRGYPRGCSLSVPSAERDLGLLVEAARVRGRSREDARPALGAYAVTAYIESASATVLESNVNGAALCEVGGGRFGSGGPVIRGPPLRLRAARARRGASRPRPRPAGPR